MALLNIQASQVPKGATHVSQDGRYIKDEKAIFAHNGQHLEYFHYWDGSTWVISFGRHCSKVAL